MLESIFHAKTPNRVYVSWRKGERDQFSLVNVLMVLPVVLLKVLGQWGSQRCLMKQLSKLTKVGLVFILMIPSVENLFSVL